MKVYRYLIAFYLTFCISLSMNFVAFADTSTNTNTEETSNNNNEVTIKVDAPSNIGTTPEVEEEIIIEDDNNIAQAKLSKDTVNSLKNNDTSNNSQIEIIDENVPFSAKIEEDKTSTAVPLHNTPKTADTNLNQNVLMFLSIFSLGSIVIITKINFKKRFL